MSCLSRLCRVRVLLLCIVLVGVLCACSTVDVNVSLGGNDDADSVKASVGALDGIDATSQVVAVSKPAGELWELAGGTVVDLSGEDGLTAADVLSHEPDLVLTSTDVSAPDGLEAALGDTGVPMLTLDEHSFAEYEARMAELVELTGREDLYETNVSAIAEKVGEALAHSAVEGRGKQATLRIGANGQVLCGSDDFLCSMLAELGLENVSAGEGAVPLSLKALSSANPDWILVVYAGEGIAPEKELASLATEDAWQSLSAVRQGRVVVLPQTIFEYPPNTRWVEAYTYLTQVLHGAWA